jgi:hypothetical protein
VHSFSGPSPVGLATIFYCFRYETFLSQSGSELIYDWRFTANKFALATSPLRHMTGIFIFQLNTCGYCPYVTSSLTRGWVHRLQLLLVLASAVILRSGSRGTLDHILLDFPFKKVKMKIKVTLRLTVSQSPHDQIFVTLWQLRSCFCGAPSLTGGRVCLLYMLLVLANVVFLGSESLGTRDNILLSQIWDLLFIASYDSQGHGGGIRPCLHTGGRQLTFLYSRSTDYAHRKHSLSVLLAACIAPRISKIAARTTENTSSVVRIAVLPSNDL